LELAGGGTVRQHLVLEQGRKELQLRVGAAALPFERHLQRGEEALFQGDVEEGVAYGGQGVAGIKDVPTCQELIDRIMLEAAQVLQATRALQA
ncbi:MAG: hypothetical protein NTU41_02085, partial [Chloroflexi bacterium]|nr:hypothetical protein [Chloroflexota bacterium]